MPHLSHHLTAHQSFNGSPLPLSNGKSEHLCPTCQERLLPPAPHPSSPLYYRGQTLTVFLNELLSPLHTGGAFLLPLLQDSSQMQLPREASWFLPSSQRELHRESRLEQLMRAPEGHPQCPSKACFSALSWVGPGTRKGIYHSPHSRPSQAWHMFQQQWCLCGKLWARQTGAC